MEDNPSPRQQLLLPGTREGRDPKRSIPRGPRRTPPEVVAATQRERLLDGFVRTVAQLGYSRARVSDICQAAGVTRPVFYELFAGKEDAFLAAHRHGTGLLLRAMEEAHDRAPDWPGGVRAGLRTLLTILAEAPAFAVMAVVEIEAIGAAGRQERTVLLDRFRRFFRDAPLPQPPLAAQELVDTVIGGVYAAVYRRVAAGETGELPALLPGLTYFVLAPFLGPELAAARLDGLGLPGASLPSCLVRPESG